MHRLVLRPKTGQAALILWKIVIGALKENDAMPLSEVKSKLSELVKPSSGGMRCSVLPETQACCDDRQQR